MTIARQLKLVRTRKGRIIIHLITVIRDKHIQSHFQGIMREFMQQGKAIV